MREQGLEVLAAAAAQLEALAAGEHQGAVAAEKWMDFAHAIDVHDGGAVDPEELARVELGLDLVHRLSEKMCCRSNVQRDVVVRRLDPVDLCGVDDHALVTRGT